MSGVLSTRTSTCRSDGALKPQTVIETLRDMAAGGEARTVWTPGSGSTRCGRCSTSCASEPRTVYHLRRPRDDGLRPAGCGRREGGATRRDRGVRRRRRLLPDDEPGAGGLRRSNGLADRGRDHQQRLARDGAPVAKALFYAGALRRDAPHQAGARTTRSSPRRSAAAGFMVDNEADLDSTLRAAFNCRTHRGRSTRGSTRTELATRWFRRRRLGRRDRDARRGTRGQNGSSG